MRRAILPTVYIIFLMLPIYWLLSMSFKTTNEILGGFTLFPQEWTTENYAAILCGYPDILAPPCPMAVIRHGFGGMSIR